MASKNKPRTGRGGKRDGAGRPRNTHLLELPRFASMMDMSKQCGIPYSVLLESSKKGAPFKDTHGRCDILQFLAWFFRQDLSDDEQVDWGNRAKRATALIKEVELQEKRDQVVDFQTSAAFIRNLVNVAFFAELDRVASEFPATLKGKSEVEISVEVDNQIKAIKESLRLKLVEWRNGTK